MGLQSCVCMELSTQPQQSTGLLGALPATWERRAQTHQLQNPIQMFRLLAHRDTQDLGDSEPVSEGER